MNTNRTIETGVDGLVTELLQPDRHDPTCPFKTHCYCDDGAPHDAVQHPLARKAADALLALKAEVEELRALAKANNDLAKHYTAAFNAEREKNTLLIEALEPFAACVEQISPDESDEEWAKFRLLIKDYRRAAAALQAHRAAKETTDG